MGFLFAAMLYLHESAEKHLKNHFLRGLRVISACSALFVIHCSPNRRRHGTAAPVTGWGPMQEEPLPLAKSRSIIIISMLTVGILCSLNAVTIADEISSPKQDGAPGAVSPPIPPVVHLPQGPMAEPGPGGWPPLRRVAPGTFEMGGVRIIKNKQQVAFPAVVNMDKGLLEYLIVGVSGKVHESLLRTDMEPFCLQIAMLLAGFEGASRPLSFQGDPSTPEGDAVDIWIEWKDGENTVKAKIEEWVVNKAEGAHLKPMAWVFTGSFISGGRFMADMDKSIASIFHDPAALIDNPLPEGSSDEVWFVNEGTVPAMGTAVTVTIEKAAGR